DPEIEIVGEANNGEVAGQMAQQLRPNVITMDVEMPVVNGMQAVKRIMQCAPCPIIMLSSLTTSSADVTIKSLELGAVDFIAKSSSFVQLDIVKIENELQEKIHYWAKHPLKLRLNGSHSLHGVNSSASQYLSRFQPKKTVDFIVVGVSTGGPRTVLELLQKMGKLSCPMVIAQHMPKEFTPGFSEHLAFETGLSVVEGYHGLALSPGQVVVAPGGVDSQIRKPFDNHFALDIKKNEQLTLHPSVDMLFESCARICDSPVAVILTGMGDDGTQGAGFFSKQGYPVMAQEPTSCVVDGMPGSAVADGVVSEILDVENIARKLKRWCGEREFLSRPQSIGLN
ncbi:MAG: chemotaxis-specific protein-glutamate methyltransferase CheB, partial [Flavobacteriales bacterium]|nr:chemotaxis-specific protein-glutamate methyltransferase CheB [Flavobacteriales bacterium]